MCKWDTPLGGSPKAVNAFLRGFFLKNFFAVFTLASAVISIRAKSPATGIKGRWSLRLLLNQRRLCSEWFLWSPKRVFPVERISKFIIRPFRLSFRPMVLYFLATRQTQIAACFCAKRPCSPTRPTYRPIIRRWSDKSSGTPPDLSPVAGRRSLRELRAPISVVFG